jgi:predicted enzyme related to lactoylglutathione lyase
MNTPALQDQYLELTEDGTFELTCSQPDYGYSAITNYSVEVSLTENFAQYEVLTPTEPTVARMTLKDSDLAIALCNLYGFTSDETYQDLPADRVYFRTVAELSGVEGSQITSNVVYLNKVKFYLAVATPGYIYLVGAPEGWAGPTESNASHYADWRLFESNDAIGSKIYSGVFDIPAGSAMFRFYTALTGWDTDSYGSQEDDNPIEFSIDGVFSNDLVKGKGSFSFPDWPGGQMTIIVDMSIENNYSITIMAGSQAVATPRYIYLVGSPEGWAGPTEDQAEHYANWRLVDKTESGVYTGTFDMPAAPMFRFYTALTGWDADSYGSQEDDNPIDYSITDGSFNGSLVKGKGSFNFPDWPGGQLTISVDMNNSTVSIKAGA